MRAHINVNIMQIVKISNTSEQLHLNTLDNVKYISGIKNTPPNKLKLPALLKSNPASIIANILTHTTPQIVWSIDSAITDILEIFNLLLNLLTQNILKIVPIVSMTYIEFAENHSIASFIG